MKLLLLAVARLDADEEIGTSRLSRMIRVHVRRRGSAQFVV